jgi:hypothetical protein
MWKTAATDPNSVSATWRGVARNPPIISRRVRQKSPRMKNKVCVLAVVTCRRRYSTKLVFCSDRDEEQEAKRLQQAKLSSLRDEDVSIALPVAKSGKEKGKKKASDPLVFFSVF